MILFIVNPISGQGSKTRVVSRLRRQDCRIVYTEYAETKQTRIYYRCAVI